MQTRILITLLLLVASGFCQSKARTSAEPEHVPLRIHADLPLYPSLARYAHISGTVEIQVTVEKGAVVDAQVKSSKSPLLSIPALENVKTWQFQSEDRTTFLVTYVYQLEDKKKPLPENENPRVELGLPRQVKVTARPFKPSCDDCRARENNAAVTDQEKSPFLLHADVPLYPGMAKVARISGTVQVEVMVKDGSVVSTVVLKSSAPILVNATTDNLKTWEFLPQTNTKFITTYVYELEKKEAPFPESPRIQMQLPKHVKITVRPTKPTCMDCGPTASASVTDQKIGPVLRNVAPLCQALEQVKTGDHHTLTVSAIYMSGLEASFLYDPQCHNGEPSTWVEFVPKLKDRDRLERIQEKSSNRAYVQFEGEFFGPKPINPDLSLPDLVRKSGLRYGHLGGYKTMLVVHSIKQIEPVPNGVPFFRWTKESNASSALPEVKAVSDVKARKLPKSVTAQSSIKDEPRPVHADMPMYPLNARISPPAEEPQCFNIHVRLNGKLVDGPQVITLKIKQSENPVSLEGGCFRVPPALLTEKAVAVFFTMPENKVYLAAISPSFFAVQWDIELEDKKFDRNVGLPKHARIREACVVVFRGGDPETELSQTGCRMPLQSKGTGHMRLPLLSPVAQGKNSSLAWVTWVGHSARSVIHFIKREPPVPSDGKGTFKSRSE